MRQLRAKPKKIYIPWHELKPLTDALLKFSLEHGFPEKSPEIQNIKNCVLALEEEKFSEAKITIKIYILVKKVLTNGILK